MFQPGLCFSAEFNKCNMRYAFVTENGLTLCEPNFTIGPENPVMALINLITEKLLASAFVSGCAVVFVVRTIKTIKDRRDSNRIYEVLRRFAQDGQHMFRSSGRISGITNLTQSRISDLCSKHPNIERKEHELHMWRVVN